MFLVEKSDMVVTVLDQLRRFTNMLKIIGNIFCHTKSRSPEKRKLDYF